MIVLFGASSGQVPPVDLMALNAHDSLFVTRPSLEDYTVTYEELLERARRVYIAVIQGKLFVTIEKRFALADAASAVMESRATSGKIILVP
jgi:NADPH2:quinone reductase